MNVPASSSSPARASAPPVAPMAARLAARAMSIDADRLPEAVRLKVGTCLLDFLSACLAGADRPWSRQAIDAARADGDGGPCTVLVDGRSATPGAAAFAGAVLGGSTSQMDTYAASATHPGVVVFPAALALAQARRRSGADLVAAVAAGYEVAGALGEVMYAGATEYLLRPTGVVGPIAAAATAARLAALPAEAAAHAIALAANASSGLMEWSRAGTMDLQFHSAFAARNGLAACALASAGAAAAPTALDGPFGLIATLAPGAVGRDLDDRPPGERMLDVLHKPAAACVFVQSPCQAAEAVARRAGFDPARIRALRVGAHPSAIGYPGCDNAAPCVDPQVARMSIQHSVASVLVRGAIDARNWLDPASDARVAPLAARAVLVPLPKGPVHGCFVEVELETGDVLREGAQAIRAPAHADIVARFGAAAEGRLAPETVAQVVGWAGDLRALKDVDALVRAVRTSRDTDRRR